MFFNSNIKAEDLYVIELVYFDRRLPESKTDPELERLLNLVCARGKVILVERFTEFEGLLIKICYPALYHHPPCPKKTYVFTPDRDLACDVMGYERDSPEEKVEFARMKAASNEHH